MNGKELLVLALRVEAAETLLRLWLFAATEGTGLPVAQTQEYFNEQQ